MVRLLDSLFFPGLLLALVLIAALVVPRRRALADFVRGVLSREGRARTLAAHAAEILALCLIAGVVLLEPLVLAGAPLRLAPAFGPMLLLMGLPLALSRSVRSTVAFGALVWAWWGLGLGLIYRQAASSLAEAREAVRSVPGLDRQLAIPSAIMVLRIVPLLLAPVAAAIVATRGRFGWPRWIAGAAFGSVVVHSVFFGGLPESGREWVGFAAAFAFALALVALPLQRRAIARHFGIEFGAETPAPKGGGAWLVGQASAFALLASIAFYAVAGHYERGTLRILGAGPDYPARNPALRNAYDDLKEFFVKGESPYLDFGSPGDRPPEKNPQAHPPEPPTIWIELPFEFGGDLLASPLPPALVERAFEGIDLAALEATLEPAAPFFAALERAATADYCAYDEPDRPVMPNFINFRTAARLLAIRAHMRRLQGRHDEALADANTILHAGRLLKDDAGTLVTYMIGVALTRIGLGSVHCDYLRHREDPERIAAISDLLERHEAHVRRGFDFERLSRNEWGWWKVVPYFEIAVPHSRRAARQHELVWTHLDFLRLWIAADAVRRERGAPPERIADLAPAFDGRVPPNPADGADYEYAVEGNEARLGFGPIEDPRLLVPPVDEWLTVLPSATTNRGLVETLDRRDARVP